MLWKAENGIYMEARGFYEVKTVSEWLFWHVSNRREGVVDEVVTQDDLESEDYP